jgi:hypothetical protein
VYENVDGGGLELVLEDKNGNRQHSPTQQQRPVYVEEDDDDEFDEEVKHDPTKPRPDETRRRVLEVKHRTVYSDEL